VAKVDYAREAYWDGYFRRLGEAGDDTDEDEKPELMAAPPPDPAKFKCWFCRKSAGTLCVEGLMYRHHPQTSLARRLVADGAVGELAQIRAALSVSVPPGDIRRSVELGGGPCWTSAVTA
jgi:hypothetical protein